MASPLEETLSSIKSHAAVNNGFYDAWTAAPFAVEKLEVFARNYLAWVEAFPSALAILVQSEEDVRAKTSHAKTLYSELGYGNADKAHSVLLKTFLHSLGHRMQVRGDLAQSAPFDTLLPSTQALIDGEKWLYGHKHGACSAGAQLALEWQAYTMLRRLYDGARNYMSLWSDEDEFHQDCEYFYVHIGSAEKDHKAESLLGTERYAADAESMGLLVTGFERHLSLIAGFWNGIHANGNCMAVARA